MFSKFVWFLLVIVATQAKFVAFKIPRDLDDEVREQLNQLVTIVQGNILAAHSDLYDLGSDFLTNSNNTFLDGTIAIQQEQESINSQLNSVKDLAIAANVDISPCTDNSEDMLNTWPDEYIDLMRNCISDYNQEEGRIVSDANYVVDVSFSRVRRLEFQINQCGGELLCVSPLLTEIELDKVRLPQNIHTEVNAAITLVTTLKNSVQGCADIGVSEYTADATTRLRDITDCANKLLG